MGRPVKDPPHRITKLSWHLSGLKRYQVAAAVGVHAASLSQYAIGRTTIPPEVLMRLSQVLHVPIEDLVGWMD